MNANTERAQPPGPVKNNARPRKRGIVHSVRLNLLSGRRLKTRLVFWTAAIVVLAVGGSLELRTRVTASMLERDMEERSLTLVRAAIRAFQGEIETTDPALIQSRLQDFVDADPAMSRIELVRATGGSPALVTTTADGTEPLVDILPPASTVYMAQRGRVRELITIEPIGSTGYWIVAMTSLEGLDRYVAVNRLWAVVSSAGVVVFVILLMSLLFDRLISRRFDRLLSNLSRAEESGVAPEGEPDDEIGLLARMFGDLLARVRSLNQDLRSQVAEATDSLNRRNRRLEETMQQLIVMQKKLLQSERLATVGQMAATFAHEIGSPLSSLSAHIQLLLEEPDLPSDYRETLETIRGEVHSLVQIVNELLRAARHGPEDFIPVDIGEVVESVHRLVEPKLRSQSIEVRSTLGAVPPIRGYPLYLEEVMLNLINNASEAMPKGGRLDLDVWYDERDNEVRVRVADTGPGIDPGVIERVFESFVTTRDLGSGTGLGLGIVREIMTSHNGTVELASRDGQGASALLSFPVLGADYRNGNAANTDR